MDRRAPAPSSDYARLRKAQLGAGARLEMFLLYERANPEGRGIGMAERASELSAGGTFLMTQTKPIRIQRKRSRGWTMPPNTVYVGRPTIWGNPFRVSN